ncbi:MAG: AAA family ATPase [Dehalococcoidia bacterium]|jgi:tRNA uridine 5-carbamoylmethylation protein Kti12
MLILVRGLPGSGKTTFAEKMNIWSYETDDYFMTDDGYKFDKSQLADAHNWCIEITRRSLREGNDVVVSNTFSTIAEIETYIHHATCLNHNIVVFKMTGNYGSIHNVPENTIERMRERWENYPGEICI